MEGSNLTGWWGEQFQMLRSQKGGQRSLQTVGVGEVTLRSLGKQRRKVMLLTLVVLATEKPKLTVSPSPTRYWPQ